MSFLDNVVLPNNNTSVGLPKTGGSGFLNSVVLPTNQPEANKINDLTAQAQVAKANSDYASSWTGMLKNAASFVGNKVVDIAKTGYNALLSPLQATGEAAFQAGVATRQGKPAEAIAEGLKTGVGIVGSALAPIGAVNAIAEKIPVLKQAADVMNLVFLVPGKVGEFAGDKFTDFLPISSQSKEILRPAIKEVGSLAGQIWLGGKIMDEIAGGKPIDKKTIDTLKEQAKQIPATELPAPVPVAPSIESPQVKGGFLDSVVTPEKQVIEPKQYPPVNNLPEIKPVTIRPETKIYELKTQIDAIKQALDESPAKDLLKYVSKTTGRLPEVTGNDTMQSLTGSGKTVKNSEFGRRGDAIVSEIEKSPFTTPEEAQIAIDKYLNSRSKLQELTTELTKVKGDTFVGYTPEQIDKINNLFKQASEGTAALSPVPSTGKIMTSRLAENVDTNAIEKKLTKGLGDLPEYNRVNMKEQAQLATSLLEHMPDLAKEIAMGRELPPAHILPEAIFTAVENKAIREGDVQTLRELATESNMSTQATAMGQRIRTLGERDQTSPVKIMQDIKDARESSIKPKAKQTVVDEIKTEIKKTASKRVSWEDFINEIKCNY